MNSAKSYSGLMTSCQIASNTNRSVNEGGSLDIGHSGAQDGDSFMQMVLSWRSADFLEDKLFHDCLLQIPPEFSTVTSWYDHFYPFVLEEMRAQIASVARRSFFMVPHCAVRFVCNETAGELSRKPIHAYMILPTGVEEGKFEEACTCTVGLLVKRDGATRRDLANEALAKLEHLLVRIEFMLKEDGGRMRDDEKEIVRRNPECTIFKVMLGNNQLSRSLLFGASDGQKWELYAMGVGTYSAIRTCDALSAKESPPVILPDVLTGTSCSAQYPLATAPLRGDHPLEVSHQFTSTLNQSQKNAVTAVLEVGDPVRGLPAIQIIKGPPGKLPV
jgi:hypothetical protein